MPKKRINKKLLRKDFSLHTKNNKNWLINFLEETSLRTKLLLSLGILLIIIPLFFYTNEFVQLSFFTPKVPVMKTTKHHASPIEIQIPGVRMDLSISETAISHNIWQIADAGASHLAVSSRPGEDGPIILYAHNTNDRFGPIRWLSQGQEIQLITEDSRVHTYKIIKTLQVDSDKTSIFFSDKGERLFLYTCDGFADLKRFIVIATPV